MKDALVVQSSEMPDPEPRSILMLQNDRIVRPLQPSAAPCSSLQNANDTGPFVVTDLLRGTSYQVACVGPSYELRLQIQHGSVVASVDLVADVLDVADRLMRSSDPLASNA